MQHNVIQQSTSLSLENSEAGMTDDSTSLYAGAYPDLSWPADQLGSAVHDIALGACSSSQTVETPFKFEKEPVALDLLKKTTGFLTSIYITLRGTLMGSFSLNNVEDYSDFYHKVICELSREVILAQNVLRLTEIYPTRIAQQRQAFFTAFNARLVLASWDDFDLFLRLNRGIQAMVQGKVAYYFEVRHPNKRTSMDLLMAVA